MGDYMLSIRLTKHGLKASPKNALLLNNIAYYLALSGEVEQAWKYLKQIRPDQLDEHATVYLPATFGLMYFRTGNPTEGQQMLIFTRIGSV